MFFQFRYVNQISRFQNCIKRIYVKIYEQICMLFFKLLVPFQPLYLDFKDSYRENAEEKSKKICEFSWEWQAGLSSHPK